jgi:large subunit ribosomal protein L29
MPILRMKEIREMSSEARDTKLQELRTELTKVRTMIKAGGAIENPGRTKALRRAIAQILTVNNKEE